MKLVFLNTWEGIVKEPILNFVKKQSQTTDIFCFQEANGKFMSLVKALLLNYNLFTDNKKLNEKDIFCQASYIKKNLDTTTVSTLFLNEHDTGLCLYSQIKDKDKTFNICNVHGISKPGDKLDNSGRLKQSKIIIDFMKNIKGPKIIGGDFNLEFDTQSVRMFEENGYINLIKEFKIFTTRNNLSWNKYPTKQYFADYVFLSPDIKISNFSVPSIEVSDHLPMILEIN